MSDNPKITIFTCSYNKFQYISDAINSVLGQTFNNFEYVILENSTDNGRTKEVVRSFLDKRIEVLDIELSREWREKQYAESYLKNIYFPKAKGEYIMFLADDDVLDPKCFEEHLKDFEDNKDHRANHHAYRVVHLNSSEPDKVLGGRKIFGKKINPRNQVDGGAIMFEKKLLSEARRPYFKSGWFDAPVSDGLFANKLALITDIYPIKNILHIKRVTNISTHRFINKDGHVVVADKKAKI